jgi:hypothetical protein
MKLEMNRSSHQVKITGLEEGSTVTMTFDKEAIAKDANKKGEAILDCKKYISKFLRQEISITVKQKNKNDMEHIYEVRMTKLVPKRIVEVRKEKK